MGEKDLVLKENFLEKISSEIGIPANELDYPEFIRDAVGFLTYYIKQRKLGNGFYIREGNMMQEITLDSDPILERYKK